MNEANEFYENMQSQHQAVLTWRDGSNGEGGRGSNGADNTSQTSTSVSGKGDVSNPSHTNPKKDGIPSPAGNVMDLTPNG